MQKNSLLSLENVVSAPIEEGDAGVILKADGSFKIFSTGIKGDLTPAQMEQGVKLMALSVALTFPAIMDILKQMANDPDIVGDGIDLGSPN